jgi:hypothetical protein
MVVLLVAGCKSEERVAGSDLACVVIPEVPDESPQDPECS